MYELTSIMIQTGAAFGGHYFSYIKSFEDGKWYNFNDSIVREINLIDIVETFGPEPVATGPGKRSNLAARRMASTLAQQQSDAGGMPTLHRRSLVWRMWLRYHTRRGAKSNGPF